MPDADAGCGCRTRRSGAEVGAGRTWRCGAGGPPPGRAVGRCPRVGRWDQCCRAVRCLGAAGTAARWGTAAPPRNEVDSGGNRPDGPGAGPAPRSWFAGGAVAVTVGCRGRPGGVVGGAVRSARPVSGPTERRRDAREVDVRARGQRNRNGHTVTVTVPRPKPNPWSWDWGHGVSAGGNGSDRPSGHPGSTRHERGRPYGVRTDGPARVPAGQTVRASPRARSTRRSRGRKTSSSTPMPTMRISRIAANTWTMSFTSAPFFR